MPPTEEQIRRAYEDITHGCDGPVNCFVLISRAIELASKKSHSNDALANALEQALEMWGVDFTDTAIVYHRS